MLVAHVGFLLRTARSEMQPEAALSGTFARIKRSAIFLSRIGLLQHVGG